MNLNNEVINMREILFRGKTPEDKWLFGTPVKSKGLYEECIEIVEKIVYSLNEYEPGELAYVDGERVDPKTIGQFTGLLDKNGKKIFEGDIVKFCSGEIRSVAFDENYSEFEFSRKDPVENVDGLALCVDHDVCEVIGNIYDNPELR